MIKKVVRYLIYLSFVCVFAVFVFKLNQTKKQNWSSGQDRHSKKQRLQNLRFSPFWSAVFICFITTLVTMYLIGGATKKPAQRLLVHWQVWFLQESRHGVSVRHLESPVIMFRILRLL